MTLPGERGAIDPRCLDALVRPRTIGVIGASPSRQTLGTIALDNLVRYGYAGTVVPIHAEAERIAGFATVRSVEDLPDGVDVVLASVPAAGVADIVRRLDRRGVPTAIVNTAGFSPAQDAELKALVSSSRIVMHGPNCMGLINLSDATPIYTGGITSRVRRGEVALIAQSGSAAISVINSSDVGFSKILSIGSEYRVTAADYLGWLGADDDTAVIGLVLEAIPDADRFADAVERVHEAGKSLVVLKVGRSRAGAQATLAHTGALIHDGDAFAAFAERFGIPVVDDYEELIASLEAFARCRRRPVAGQGVALIGISGGETALACDLCEELGLPLAVFGDATSAAVQDALPGVAGQNPLDIGQSIGRQAGGPGLAMAAIMNAEETGLGIVIQDMQASLPETSHRNYTAHLTAVAEVGRATGKPMLLVSPTSAAMSARLSATLSDVDIPTLRGLRPGLAAAAAMMRWSSRSPEPRRVSGRAIDPGRALLRDDVAAHHGPLPAALVSRLLAHYGIPVVRSAVVPSVDAALAAAARIGFPMVVKVASGDIPHRSEIGAVQLGVTDGAGLRAAIATIESNVRRHLPEALIEGYELQEELTDRIEAVVGYKACPPFGALTVVGTGGVLVELENDRAVTLSPASCDEIAEKLSATRLGSLLGGYRNLIPRTDTLPLATLVARVSELAADLCDLIPECDLNPVLIQKGTGDVRVVDALLVARSAGRPS